MDRSALVALLREHRYSGSPWACRCGAPLENSEIAPHVADVLLTAMAAVV